MLFVFVCFVLLLHSFLFSRGRRMLCRPADTVVSIIHQQPTFNLCPSHHSACSACSVCGVCGVMRVRVRVGILCELKKQAIACAQRSLPAILVQQQTLKQVTIRVLVRYESNFV